MANEKSDKNMKSAELVPWRRFPDMPRWEREMERRFGDFFDGEVNPSRKDTRMEGRSSHSPDKK